MSVGRNGVTLKLSLHVYDCKVKHNTTSIVNDDLLMNWVHLLAMVGGIYLIGT